MMKKHKILSLVLAFCLCFAMAMPALATDNDGIEVKEKNIEVNGYSFKIIEDISEDFSIVRIYTNNARSIKESNDVDKGRALLIALGMDEENLELWDDETILSYLNSEQITTSVAYYEVNEENNTMAKISEDEAIEKSFITNQERALDRLSEGRVHSLLRLFQTLKVLVGVIMKNLIFRVI